jgi:exodeoxyribonuclease VII small subunit
MSEKLPPNAGGNGSPNWRYEETVTEVEAIITRIESGELDLADVFDQFEQAVQYIQQCEAFLSDRQAQMELLIETLEDTSGS